MKSLLMKEFKLAASPLAYILYGLGSLHAQHLAQLLSHHLCEPSVEVGAAHGSAANHLHLHVDFILKG